MLKKETTGNSPIHVRCRQIMLLAFIAVATLYGTQTQASARYYDSPPSTQELVLAQGTSPDSNSNVALNEPYRSDAELLTWTVGKVQEIVHFDYDDFRVQLTRERYNFTSAGLDRFAAFLKQLGIFDIIQENMDGVRITIDAAPEITNAGVSYGIYKWDMRFPVTIAFNGKQPPPPIKTTLVLRLARVPMLQNKDGIAIDNWEVAAPKPN